MKTTHPLHDYIARQLTESLRSRSVVVWYDLRREFAPFVSELRDGADTQIGPIDITVGDLKAALISHDGSMFEVRSVAEPLVDGEHPESLLIYVPGLSPEPSGSVLAELEKAGYRYETQLKRLARNLLRQQYTDGVIDDLLERDGVTYEDLARASEPDNGDEPSILKAIYHDVPGRDEMLAAWMAADDRDEAISTKGAAAELVKLIASRTGLSLDAADSLTKLRTLTARYVLVGEFRGDLTGPAPASIEGIPAPRTKPEVDAVNALAVRLRSSFPDAYVAMADRLEAELGLAAAGIAPDTLGPIDTFRFEETVILGHVGELIAAAHYEEASRIVAGRERSFWLDRDVGRRAQWQACSLMAELGRIAVEVRSAASATNGAPDVWIAKYTELEHGWYRLDQSQRRLETLVASLDDEPAARPLGLVRRAHEDAAKALADRFIPSLTKADWSTSGTMHQTRVYADAVSPQPKPVAYFLVDAMRYEMGVELMQRLPASTEASLTPAVAALPSITPIGMAALMPGAAASFDVVDSAGKLGSRIGGAFLPDLTARRKFADARVPGLVDMTLADLLGTTTTKLVARFAGAQVVIVRSQEIDAAGEGGFFQARRTMDTVIDDLARAIKKLGVVGVRHAVISADHGHLFGHGDREEAERVDAPGGATVDLHRRVWIGRGGMTPPGAIRVSAATLGYDSDLDLVFPPGTSVFKAGGDLGFHHGGPTLQELIVPVLTVRTAAPVAAGKPERLTVTGMPVEITNRIFSAMIQLGDANLSMFSTPTVVNPVLMGAGRQVGKAALAIGSELDTAGSITLVPGVPVTVGFRLTDDTVGSLRLVVVDPATDAELYKSPNDVAVNLGVA